MVLGEETYQVSIDAVRSLTCNRRSFIGLSACAALALTGCGSTSSAQPVLNSDANVEKVQALPDASPDPDSPFAVDTKVNMQTIDEYLGISGVAYRDMRMLVDPADYGSVGGNSDLTDTLEGFTITPFPYIGTLAPLPVSGAYSGESLFHITWGEGIEILDATPNYEESLQVIEDLFPRDTPLVLICGGGGYGGMMRSLLLYLGYDATLLYNAGGMWEYTGYRSVQLISRPRGEEPHYYLWRVPIAQINFDQLHPIAEEADAGELESESRESHVSSPQ